MPFYFSDSNNLNFYSKVNGFKSPFEYLTKTNVVTDNLVLYLDAGNSDSYPGSGNIWTDLSPNAMSWELVNSPTYSKLGPGFFQFNGLTNFSRAQNNILLDTQTPSVEVWIKTNVVVQNGFWFEKGLVNTQYSLFQEGSVIQWRQRLNDPNQSLVNLSTTTANFINTSNWYQIVGTFVSGDRRLYINGDLVNSDTLSGTIATNNGGMSIGVYGGFSGSRAYYYNGSLSICRVYNKVLTQSEIRQNFDAQRQRFGI